MSSVDFRPTQNMRGIRLSRFPTSSIHPWVRSAESFIRFCFIILSLLSSFSNLFVSKTMFYLNFAFSYLLTRSCSSYLLAAASSIAVIQQGIALWQNNTCLNFVENPSGDNALRFFSVVSGPVRIKINKFNCRAPDATRRSADRERRPKMCPSV